MDKIENMHEQIGNVNREMEILRKNQKCFLKTVFIALVLCFYFSRSLFFYLWNEEAWRIPSMGFLVDGVWLRKESKIKGIWIESLKTKMQREHRLKETVVENIQCLWDSHRKNNIHIMRITEEEEREKGKKEILEIIMTENFPKMMSDTNPRIQEAQSTASRINVKKTNKQANKNYM